MIIQGSPEILRGPRGLNSQFGAFSAVISDSAALDFAYRSATGQGAYNYLIDPYGGYGPVMQVAKDQGFTPTPEWIQNYEISNKLPESAYTKLNKQFVGPVGEQKYEDLTDALTSQNAAIAQAAAAELNRQSQAAADQFNYEQSVRAAAAAAEAVKKKAIADAYEAAKIAAAKAEAATTYETKRVAEALRVRALVAVKALYLQVLGREGDQAGLDYFADRFGDVIDPDELQIFSDMSKPEIDARNKYLADMAAKSKEDAVKAKAIADGFAATAAKAKADAAAAAAGGNGGGGGGISPVLILAAAAAAFFIGG